MAKAEHPVFSYLDVKKQVESNNTQENSWLVMRKEPLSSILGKLEQTFACLGYYWLNTISLYIDGKKLGNMDRNFNGQALLPFAKPSGFGKGARAMFDETVRRAWEIEGSRISMRQKYGSDCSLGDAIARQLQVMAPPHHYLRTKLHKLAIYKSGGHFTKHQDTLHGDNHIASLVVVFGNCKGGDLVIEHEDQHVTLSSSDTAFRNYAIFFTDCRHEVLPVTSGYRCALQYDVYKEPGADDTLFQDLETGSDGEQVEDDRLKCILTERLNAGSSIIGPVIPNTRLQELTDAIQHCLEQSTGVAFLLRHQYRAAAITAVQLKGLDAQLYESLVESFEIQLTPLLITNLSYDPPDEYSWWAQPFPNDPRLPKKVYLILARGDKSSIQKVHSTEYIEHTGNEPQAEENAYFSGAMVFSARPSKWKHQLQESVLPCIRALPPSQLMPNGGADYSGFRSHFLSLVK